MENYTPSDDAIFILSELDDWCLNRYKTAEISAELPDQPYSKDFYEGAKSLLRDLDIFLTYMNNELTQRHSQQPKKAKIIPFIPRSTDDDDDYE